MMSATRQEIGVSVRNRCECATNQPTLIDDKLFHTLLICLSITPLCLVKGRDVGCRPKLRWDESVILPF